ncbi:MAG: DUF373 family protein, partial [Candidatus Aenigmatarchaeota archaeon]
MQQRDKILIINVDRDDDIGQKTGIRGPVIGKDNVLKAGTELGIADPECSDLNAIFQTLKTYEEMKKQYNVEIAILTGDKDVGVKSDRIIGEQLRTTLRNFEANFVVLVTDGSEDEHVIPVIQSRIPILSVKRVVVKQADELQSIYFKVKDFLKESLEDPKISRLVLGIPAIVLIIYAIFGIEGWRLMIGAIGAYLFIKGFKLDDYVTRMINEFVNSFHHRRFAFFGYVAGMCLAALATYRGFLGVMEQPAIGIFETAATFLVHSAFLYFMGGTIAWIGRNVSVKKRTMGKTASIPLFGFAITIVTYSASQSILKNSTGIDFIYSLIVGFAVL